MAEVFDITPEGEEVRIVTLRGGGAVARVMTWGASLQDFRLDGVDHALVLGAPVFPPYRAGMRTYGCIVGRVANRIAGGRALLDGRALELERNEAGRTAIHGGSDGAGYVNWRLVEEGEASCALALRLADGQAGYPGNLDLAARYSLGPDGTLMLEIEGRTDAPTFCNPAHHSYWNLDGRADISAHRLMVAADSYLPVDARKIPLGGPAPVEGTRFDFRAPRVVTRPEDGPLDHNFCLREGRGEGLRPACVLEAGGLRLEIATTAPGLQVYDGAGINSAAPGHGGVPYGPGAGVAIEPQHWPDAPNRPGYPPVVLRPGETFRQVSRFHVTRAGG